MKIFFLYLIPIASMAFAPVGLNTRTVPKIGSPNMVVTKMKIDDIAEKVTSTTEGYIGKADSLILSRAMRVVDHAPLLYTLKALTDKSGITFSMSGITSNPGAFAGLATALSVPTWCFNVWTLIILAQAASVVRSILSPSNELSQAGITSTTAANYVATMAIGSATPLRDTILLALASGYSVRSGTAGGDVTLSNAGLQLMSSFTTVLAVLGVVSKVSPKIPIIGSNPATATLLGVTAMYVMTNRAGNGSTKKAVNASILGGIVAAAVSEGFSFSASVSSILSNIGLVGTAYTAYLAINSLRKAIL